MLKTKQGLEIPCVCVTNRKLCREDFLERLRQIADSGQADAIVLREKDLSEKEYYRLAEQVMRICDMYSIPCVLHSFYRVAVELGCRRIHFPYAVLERQFQSDEDSEIKWKDMSKDSFDTIGTSVHSVEQAEQAIRFGAGYVIAGHIFDTNCKKGLPGRGLSFVRDVSHAVPTGVPVFGIGGINAWNAPAVVKAGAAGVCIMSGFMVESKSGLC